MVCQQFVARRVSAVLLLSLFLGLYSPQKASAQGSPDTGGRIRAITTAVPFLMICPDSRSGAMGEAGVAIAKGANALYWNPSLLAFSEERYGFSVNYTPWLRGLGIPDINHAFLPGYFRLKNNAGVIGGSLTFFSLGNIEFTDNGGVRTGEFNASELAGSVYYTLALTDNFAVGAGLRYIRSNLAGATSVGGFSTKPGQSGAGDMNFLYNKDFKLKTGGGQQVPLNFKFGANITNIGAKMNYTESTRRDFIPTNMRLGYALTFKFDDYNSIAFTNDFNKLLVPSAGGASDAALLEGIFQSFGDAPGGFSEEISEINTSLGLEYNYNDIFYVRAGYFYEDPNKGNRKFITLGAGFSFRVVDVDFAYLAPFQQNHPLQNTLRFSISMNFE